MQTPPAKLFLLACTIWLAAPLAPRADDVPQRFLEFSAPGGKTQTYDLGTVQIVQPGRFTIISTSIDDPDVMRLELKVLAALRKLLHSHRWKIPSARKCLHFRSA